ncbi:hypothetical protein FW781_13985 [Chryseobacterium panacisoli]|uniref:DoxX family protein n=1 Tax=Chryseobacterium panacisoli TaxID=1807141 RepID=A0A5D8ZLF5_9FLAO|nr:hypothetical protein [Chryseobacterium panacisoli]TZF95003.1 hypothetical protein FW781_13985 [Chryseobacterium panacisoli]
MPEAILPIVLIISMIIFKLTRKEYEFALSARIAMAVMLLTAGIAHFVYTQGMALMIPGIIPYKKEMVYVTGVLEIIGAVTLLIPGFQKTIGWLLIVFFVLILPANLYAASEHVNMKSGDFSGSGLSYLWYRIPLQLVFISWVYFSCIRIPVRMKSGFDV